MAPPTHAWTRSHIWITVAIAAGAALVTGLVVWLATSANDSAAPGPTPTLTVTATPTVVPEPTPTPQPTPEATVATCENIVTEGLRAMMALQEWTVEETTGAQIGATPFAKFPDGPPPGQLICRWAADHTAATDNVVDFAWAPVEESATAGIVDALVGAGYTRQDTDAGIVVLGTFEGDDAYVFTGSDVRWAPSIEAVGYVTAPTETP